MRIGSSISRGRKIEMPYGILLHQMYANILRIGSPVL